MIYDCIVGLILYKSIIIVMEEFDFSNSNSESEEENFPECPYEKEMLEKERMEQQRQQKLT